MNRPMLLDLFCGAGGAAKGYHDAGFDVVGVDINPQPHYPYHFVLGDVMRLDADWIVTNGFAAIHASPPCQAYSVCTVQHRHNDYPDLVAPTRDLLDASGLPWVIENVPGAPLVAPGQMTFDGRSSIMLCGSMLGMERLQRHRIFETNWPLLSAMVCSHQQQNDVMSIVGHSEQGSTGRRGDHWGLDARREVMGMPWAGRDQLAEAIPPAYTEYIGRQLMEAI